MRIMDKINLRNKNVFITGASSGIGKELSKCFAEEGAHLVLSSHPGERKILLSWADELSRAYNIKTFAVTVDLAEPDGPEKVYQEAMKQMGNIDILVNNAGIISYGNFHEIPLETHKKIVSVNLNAYMVMMHLFASDMKKGKTGYIFNVSSVSAFLPTPKHAVYGATKAFVQSLSEALSTELKGTGVNVFTLNPGYTDTPLLKGKDFPDKLWFYYFTGKSNPREIAKQGVMSFKRGEKVFIPGKRLKFIFTFLIRITPRRLLGLVSSQMLKGI